MLWEFHFCRQWDKAYYPPLIPGLAVIGLVVISALALTLLFCPFL